LKVALTTSFAVTVTVHVSPVPTQLIGEPLKPAKVPGVLAVRIT